MGRSRITKTSPLARKTYLFMTRIHFTYPCATDTGIDGKIEMRYADLIKKHEGAGLGSRQGVNSYIVLH